MSAANKLVAWYREHGSSRKLPWRKKGEPIARVAMVEGLLAQTRANAVARAYDQIFGDIYTAGDWLRTLEVERIERVTPLGLPGLKSAALDSIAGMMVGFDDQIPAKLMSNLTAWQGIGPYTAGMLAVLFGHDAVPVDCNVARVGGRADASGDPARWMAEIVADAADIAPIHEVISPKYEATCAVLDIGQIYCKPLEKWCGLCPLKNHCETQGKPGCQLILPVSL